MTDSISGPTRVRSFGFNIRCRRFLLRAIVRRDRRLPVVDEFVLRALKICEDVPARRLATYFGFTPTETGTVMADLKGAGLITLEGDTARLHLSARRAWRATCRHRMRERHLRIISRSICARFDELRTLTASPCTPCRKQSRSASVRSFSGWMRIWCSTRSRGFGPIWLYRRRRYASIQASRDCDARRLLNWMESSAAALADFSGLSGESPVTEAHSGGPGSISRDGCC